MSNALDGSGELGGSTELGTCRRVEALLLRDLQTLLGRPRRSTTRDELLGLLKFLEFNLRRQISLRAKFENGAAAALHDQDFRDQLQRLQRQLESCRECLEEIRIQVLVAPSFAEIASEVRANLRRWMAGMLQPAQRQQQRLLQRQFTTEMGGAA